jgi:hypothetical protein
MLKKTLDMIKWNLHLKITIEEFNMKIFKYIVNKVDNVEKIYIVYINVSKVVDIFIDTIVENFLLILMYFLVSYIFYFNLTPTISL